ncbi:UNVERIFIED_CONTAM: hypothetical protein PYX00_000815 [Menopon gallinae]|uniref:Uncharacterized protein n=1 Tax=Menopon gallinae TaxID=328185 RepID=A0AAW2IAJ3_9NEOP
MPSPSHRSSPVCPPYVSGKLLLETDFAAKTNFPSTFQDFFTKLSEVSDDNDENSASLLENKQLLPPKMKAADSGGYRRKLPERHWSMNRRSFRRRHNEVQSKGSARTEGKVVQQISLPGHSSSSVFVSPMTSRRRSSSIAVARVPPDLNR